MVTIGNHLKLVTEDLGNKEYFTVIRRAFHTLKGSGRMVGLMRFGEASWAIEQTMNQWLQDNKPVTPDLLALLGAAHKLFTGWVHDLANTGASSADGLPLIAAAEQARAGGPMSLPAAGQPAAAAPPAPAEAAPKAPFDTTIIIGDIRVSPGLYNIFVEESDIHLTTMQKELVVLAAEPQPPRDELIRAAHTLAGIAGTVNFSKLNELGRGFERMLVAARAGGITLDRGDMAMARATVDAFEAMVGAVKELRPPPAADELAARLESRRAEWVAQAGEALPGDAILLVPDEPSIDLKRLARTEEIEVPAPAAAAAEPTWKSIFPPSARRRPRKSPPRR